ncbi:MAG TPA: hypothetical protein PKH93_06745 [Chitinophagales bacterium]|nr:hypothetical protein [Chitinophagales bacterium]HNL07255.1 hypothetical protein [Chitinophagales bacterium]
MKYLSLFLLLCVVSCKLIDIDPCYREYHFKIPFTLQPNNDTIHIGDTLWLSTQFSKTLLDMNTNDSIVTNDIDFQSGLIIAKIDTENYQYATQTFTIVEKQGGFINTFLGIKLHYLFFNDHYHISIGLVPTVVGTYYLAISTPFALDEVEITNDCEDYLHITYAINELIDNHFQLLQNSPDTLVSSSTLEGFNNGGYAFVVTE